MSPQTDMLSHAEGEVTIGPTVDSKLGGGIKDLLIAVGRRIEERGSVSRSDLRSAKIQIDVGRSRMMNQRRGEA
jgi:hypothetical protein